MIQALVMQPRPLGIQAVTLIENRGGETPPQIKGDHES